MSDETPATTMAAATPVQSDSRDSDPFEVRVKPDYILKDRAESLGPIPEDRQGEDARGDRGNNGHDDDSKKKNNRKNKKKRARDERQDSAEKMCMAVMKGKTCPYGDEKCRFSHDIKAFMASRPEDIKEVEGGCPLFQKYGFCIYGIACRLGGSHITKSGDNIRKTVEEGGGENKPVADEALSFLLPKDVQIQLRKKKYDFKCKRHFEKEKDAKKDHPEETKEEAKNEETKEPSSLTSSTPIDLKTRKIIDFSNKVYVAPLTTVGNLPFRRIMKKFGADITCGEMAVGTCLLEGKQSEWALLKRHPDEDVFGIQLAAAHPDQFTRVSELVEEFADPDFVDLNLGCPLDLLCNKGAGAALMMREKKLKGALMGITATLSCPVTIKMRTGWDMNDPFAHKLVGKIQSWGIDGIAAIMVSGFVAVLIPMQPSYFH